MFSKFFIERPIFAIVIASIICLAGLVALVKLPIEQYPAITPVQITVNALYPGADARTVADSVAAPIETQLNGVDNLIYSSSTSSATGQMTLTAYFTLDTDPDIAQVLVQNRVNLALPQLPEAVTQNGVQVQKKSASIMMVIAVYAQGQRYSPDYVANYTNVYILDAIQRVPGAGQAMIFGVADQAMRIWLNPTMMTSLGITTSDMQQAVAKQNQLYGAGQIGQEPTAGPVQLNFPVVTQGPFTEPWEYEDIVLRASQQGSAIVRLKDVASAKVGRKQYVVDDKFNGVPATFIGVYQQPGANGIEVSNAVRKTLADLKPNFPKGIDYTIALDTTDFVRLSIKEVVITLIEAIVLVVLVVYAFLQSFRPTIIATVAIFVALIGTFPGMLALGFSLNLLTLFGMVLAIGMVVDDAIVVVENVERNMAQKHLQPKEAAIQAMQEISGALVAVVLVLSSVFIPAAFLGGTTGQLYKQFAITIVISVTLSGFVALTLTPAMAASLLRHSRLKTTGIFGWFNRGFDRITVMYGHLVEFTLKYKIVALCSFVAILWGVYHFLTILPTSFVPQEDQGYVFGVIIMPDAASLDRTSKTSHRVDGLFTQDPAVEYRTQIGGYSLIDGQYKTNASTFFVKLKDFEERYASLAKAKAQNARAVLMGVAKGSSKIQDGVLIPVAPPAIPGIGTTGGFEFWIQDLAAGDPQQLQELTEKFLAKASKRPELSGLNTTFRADSQQLRTEVDRNLATLLDVPIQDVYNAIQVQFGSLVVSQYYQYSRVWDVILQSAPQFRQTPDDITRLYTRSNQNAMIPLTALVKSHYVTGPTMVPHFNGFPAAKVNGNAAQGYSSGQSITAMEEVAREILPQGYGFSWSGLAYEEKKAGATSAAAFAFGLIIVFLVLAAQYESWTLPGSVMTAIPFGIMVALLFTWLRGLDNDVYLQIGLLVLIGLGAKNAILRVSFSVEMHKQGRSLRDATIEGGELRLRPIIMTSLAFIFGVLPLAIATGAGANARHSIGTGIIGGMIGETTLAMLYVPLFFFIFEGLSERLAARKERKALRRETVNDDEPHTAPPSSEKEGI
jgi:multidrug efflux pump